jgi:hypothetical protein
MTELLQDLRWHTGVATEPAPGTMCSAGRRGEQIDASRVRSKTSAYVLDVANTFHPELTESDLAVFGSRVADLERRAA